MSQFKVANLPNLFWDNGSFKYPSTYPRLLNAEVKNKTPIMTSPTTGWVILEGDYNYCEFKGELFFLKKSGVISHKRNKWVYVLIKDHICSLFKNKAGVTAKGTLTNTDIENLGSKDFQFTFPAFQNYNKKILIPLTKAPFDWRTHGERKKITKRFDEYFPVDDKAFSNFIATLEANKKWLTEAPSRQWREVVKNNKSLVILGRLGYSERRIKGWKNELVEKINTLIDEIKGRSDILLGVISNEVITNATKINGRYAISYTSDNPLFSRAVEDREIDIDLSGLTDIELINFDNPAPREKYAIDHFNLFLSYDENLVDATFKTPDFSSICKLSRRVRISFLNEYSTRAIVKFGGRHYPFCWKYSTNTFNLFLPQKLFFKNPDRLSLKEEGTEVARRYHQYKEDNYRSVYLYWCFNLNFYFGWGKKKTTTLVSYEPNTWINNVDYFKDESKQNILRSISGNHFIQSPERYAIEIIPSAWHSGFSHLTQYSHPIVEDYYSNNFPWVSLKEPINIGWLVGQFSPYIDNQKDYFETDFPFVVRAGVTRNKKLKRIKGLKSNVASLVHMDDLFNLEGRSNVFTLDLFNPLSRRMREDNKEEDFLIGEKLLFSTWGIASYLLFQPACLQLQEEASGGGAPGYTPASTTGHYYGDDLDNYYQPQLFLKWVTPASWYWVYQIFYYDDRYLTSRAKGWFKKAYENYAPLTYKNYYYQKNNYKELVTHAIKNTEAYFETQEVDFTTNPIKELKVGDIFYSDEEWYWYDDSSARSFDKVIAGEFLSHTAVWNGRNDRLNDGEIVAYLNPKNNKVYLGRVHSFTDRVELPAGQYIATGLQISDDSSTMNYLDVRYTRITPLTTDYVERVIDGFESLDVLISTLKQSRYLKQVQPDNLTELQRQGRNYLFNLKGTPFFCALDRGGKVSLIFKNKEKYEESEHIPH